MGMFEIGKRYVVVAKREYFPLLFSYKNNNPSLNIKFIEPNELVSKISFTFAKDPTPLLIKRGIDYSNAKKYIHLFLVGDLSKNKKILDVFNAIPKDYVAKDEYGLEEIKRSELFFFEMDEDIELPSLCKRNNIPYRNIGIEDLGIKKINTTESHPPIIYFPNKYVQFFYFYSIIRERLLKEDVKDKIHIAVDDAADDYYAHLFSSLFDVPTIITTRREFISVPSVKEKMKKIYNEKSFSFSEEELKDSSLKVLHELITTYSLTELSDFSYAYANLLEIVAGNTCVEASSNKGILESNDFAIGDGLDHYVSNFKHDVFYKVETDKDVLSDKELLEIGANTSYIKTALDRRLKTNYLQYNSIKILSLAKQHLTDKIFDSQFIEEFGWENDIEIFKDEGKGVLTSQAEKMYLANKLDKSFYKDKFQEIRSYDNSFTGLDAALYAKDNKWSVSKIEKYIQCPFAYYMSFLLPSVNDDYHSRWRGDLIHSLLERINDKDYSFEKEWAKAKGKYIKEVEEKGFVFDKKEEGLLEILHYHLERIIPRFLAQNTYMTLDEKTPYAYEIPFKITLYDANDEECIFSGRIDKVIRTHNIEKNKDYYTIIDYKTGSESFILTNTIMGASTQLPFYAYALENMDYDDPNNAKVKELIEGATFAGFGIKHIYSSSPSPKNIYCKNGKLTSDAIYYNTRVSGMSLDSKDYITSFDLTALNEKGEIKQHGGDFLSKTKGTTFISPEKNSKENIVKGSNLPKYNMNDLLEDSITGILEAIRHIKACDFIIAPTSIKDLNKPGDRDLKCSYCPYRDICYRKFENIADYHSLIAKHYGLKK